MNDDLINKEVLRQRLYRIFHFYEEDYITTIKLIYIYKYTEKRAGKSAFIVLEKLFTDWPGRKKQKKIDDLFRLIQALEQRHLAAPPGARVPATPSKAYINRYIGIQKW